MIHDDIGEVAAPPSEAVAQAEGASISPRGGLRRAMNEAKTEYAVVVMGVSGSGKTTVAELLAKQLNWPFMEGDRLHPPANVEKMRQGIPLNDADRAPWLDRIGEEFKSWGAEGRSGVLTCSALKRAYRDRIRSARPDVRFVYLKGSEALIAARVAARHHEYMPASLLRSQFDTLEEPTPDEPGVVTVDAGGSAEKEVAAVIAALNLSPSPR
jgi:gluconokinase